VLRKDVVVVGLGLVVVLSLIYVVSDALAKDGFSPIALLWIGALLIILAIGLVIQRQLRRSRVNRNPN
jgi:SNF family Na+-dependent transporter